MPSVSVIMVVKNGEKYLRNAINSVINQSFQPIEIIVVDGDSTDSTAEIAKSFPGVNYRKQVGLGLANARNTGIDCASGELIAFLDCDDLWVVEKLKIQTMEFLNNQNIGYNYGNVKLFVEPGTALRPGYSSTNFEEPQHGRTPGTLMVRKSLFRTVGNFKPEHKIGCDFEWFARVMDLGVPFSYIPEILLLKRVHSENLSNDAETNRSEIFKIVRQTLELNRRKNNTEK